VDLLSLAKTRKDSQEPLLIGPYLFYLYQPFYGTNKKGWHLNKKSSYNQILTTLKILHPFFSPKNSLIHSLNLLDPTFIRIT